jgi:hypothetical protein
VDLLVLLLVLILLAFAVNVLAILLRVACHFCGVEIPTYGRALFTVVATLGLSTASALGLQAVFVGSSALNVSVGTQLVVLALDLAAFAVVTIALYVPLLRVRIAKAFNVWLMQAVVFACFGVSLGFCLDWLSRL